MSHTAADIERCIIELLQARASDASICPSEVARALVQDPGDSWRELMPQTRSVAVQMALASRVRITRQGRKLNPEALGAGPIRLKRGERYEP